MPFSLARKDISILLSKSVDRLSVKSSAPPRNAQVTQENAGTKSITSSIERREVLGVSGAGSDGGLATADVMDARASTSRWERTYWCRRWQEPW